MAPGDTEMPGVNNYNHSRWILLQGVNLASASWAVSLFSVNLSVYSFSHSMLSCFIVGSVFWGCHPTVTGPNPSEGITGRAERKCVWPNGLWFWNHNERLITVGLGTATVALLIGYMHHTQSFIFLFKGGYDVIHCNRAFYFFTILRI